MNRRDELFIVIIMALIAMIFLIGWNFRRENDRLDARLKTVEAQLAKP